MSLIERFPVGSHFKIEGNANDTVWRITDVGTRVIVAIELRPGRMDGPPYAAVETVFDEDDQIVMAVCAEPKHHFKQRIHEYNETRFGNVPVDDDLCAECGKHYSEHQGANS